MRFLVDTNILLYSVNSSCPEHARARQFLEDHHSAGTPWCLTPGIIYEFLRVSTHARVFPRPLTAAQAYNYIQRLFTREEVSVLVPSSRHWDLLEKTLRELSHPAGNLFHDIETAVLLREHGVPEIVTADTDFLQFRFLKVTNPVV